MAHMNELDIDLIPVPVRSTARRILGLTSILLGLTGTTIILFIDERLSFSVIGINIYLLISGIIYFIDGSGVSVGRWFGEAYIKIDKTEIKIKKGVFSKKWVLFWDQVDRVSFSVIRIMFSLKDGSEKELNYDNLDYVHIQEIKNIIMVITSEKNISV